MIQWYYLALISSVLMGVATIQEKRALKKEYASQYSADFAIIAAIMSLVLIPLARFNINWVELGLIYALSLVSTLSYLLTARTYRHGEIAVTTAAYSSLPSLFTVILAFIILGEKLTLIQYASVGVIVGVTYLLLFFRPKLSKPVFDKSKYIYVVIASSLANAVGAILLKFIVNTVDPFTILILVQIFSAVNFAAYMQIKYGGVGEMIKNFSKNKVTITSQAALTTAYRATYYAAAGLAAISLVAPLRNTIYVVITVLSGGLIFGEKNIKRKMLLAGVLIVASYFLIT
ncbi:MAG TPA: DMT family transporter [Candidatus Acidoferrum sp.]|nr:DMT family transporter [Candidatus Acidoferrum sp.]